MNVGNSISWFQIAALVLGSGMSTALATQALLWIKEDKRESSAQLAKARYLAMRIAIILERFAIDCANRIADNHISRQTDDVYHHISMPELPPFPEVADWETLEADLLGAALTLRSEVMLSKYFLQPDPGIDSDFLGEACDQQTGRCGYLALQAARQLRAHYKFPVFDPKDSTWDIEQTLKIKHDAATAEAVENNYVVRD